MEPPVYDGKESLTKFLQKVEAYTVYVKKDKYNLILEFINEILQLKDDKKLKSLLSVKNINELEFLCDEKHNNEIIRKYISRFEKEFSISFAVNDETDSDEISEKYVIHIITKALNNIDYTLTSRNYKGSVQYTIKMK